MSNNFISTILTTILVLWAFLIAVILGIVVGMNSFDWWTDLVFGKATGSDASTFLILPLAFLVPFFGALLIQFGLWSLIKNRVNKKN